MVIESHNLHHDSNMENEIHNTKVNTYLSGMDTTLNTDGYLQPKDSGGHMGSATNTLFLSKTRPLYSSGGDNDTLHSSVLMKTYDSAVIGTSMPNNNVINNEIGIMEAMHYNTSGYITKNGLLRPVYDGQSLYANYLEFSQKNAVESQPINNYQQNAAAFSAVANNTYLPLTSNPGSTLQATLGTTIPLNDNPNNFIPNYLPSQGLSRIYLSNRDDQGIVNNLYGFSSTLQPSLEKLESASASIIPVPVYSNNNRIAYNIESGSSNEPSCEFLQGGLSGLIPISTNVPISSAESMPIPTNVPISSAESMPIPKLPSLTPLINTAIVPLLNGNALMQQKTVLVMNDINFIKQFGIVDTKLCYLIGDTKTLFPKDTELSETFCISLEPIKTISQNDIEISSTKISQVDVNGIINYFLQHQQPLVEQIALVEVDVSKPLTDPNSPIYVVSRPQYGNTPGTSSQEIIPPGLIRCKYILVGNSLRSLSLDLPSLSHQSLTPTDSFRSLSSSLPSIENYVLNPTVAGRHKRRLRRKYNEVERLYNCNWPNCNKAYGTLTHLNKHIETKGHFPKRTYKEFISMKLSRTTNEESRIQNTDSLNAPIEESSRKSTDGIQRSDKNIMSLSTVSTDLISSDKVVFKNPWLAENSGS